MRVPAVDDRVTNPDVIAKSGTVSHPIMTHIDDPADKVDRDGLSSFRRYAHRQV